MLSVNLGRLMTWALLGSLLVWAILGRGCGKTESVESPDQADTPNQAMENVVAKEAFDLIEDNKGNTDFVILDIRTPEEFSEGHIENATNLDYYSETFKEELAQLDKSKTYLMHCRSGGRSSKAMTTMEELDFLKVYHMTDGMNGWKAGGFPVAP